MTHACEERPTGDSCFWFSAAPAAEDYSDPTDPTVATEGNTRSLPLMTRGFPVTVTGPSRVAAWFRTAKEIQPADNGASAPDGPTVWVGAVWAGKSDVDPANDHAWKHGSVSADPQSPTWLAALWTTC